MIQRSLLRTSRALSTRTLPGLSSAPSRQPSHFQSSPSQQSIKIVSRWYSEATEAKKEESPTTEGKSPAEAEAKPSAEDSLKKELESKNKEILDLKDKYLRSVADFRNLQERTKREVQASKDFALSRFAKDLVDSVDNLERALSTVPPEKLTPENVDLVNLHDGLKMTETILMQTLKKHGLERFDPAEKGEKFNPNLHEATFQTPQPDKEDGTAFFTQSKGFLLNGRVLRAAKVGVVKNS